MAAIITTCRTMRGMVDGTMHRGTRRVNQSGGLMKTNAADHA